MKKLEEAKDLFRASQTLRSLEAKFAEAISNPNCDKYDLRFGADSRFAVFEVKTHLACYTGYFGNSGCSTFTHVDSAIAQHAFVEAINKHKSLILAAMAEVCERDAAKIKSDAEAELKSAQELLAQIGGDPLEGKEREA